MIKIRKESMKQAIKYFIENEDATVKECSELFKVDRGTLRNNLKTMGVETNRRTRKCNESYFEIIDTEEKAYWLGFLLADGSIDDTKNKISIGISSIDRNHLTRFIGCIEGTHKICDYMANNNVTNKKYATSDLSITSIKMKNDLAKYNIIPNKSKEEKPCMLNENLIRHYIRGFFDGDGWITSYDRRAQDRCKNQKWEIGFGSSYFMVDYISRHLADVLNINYKEPKLNCIYRIRYSSNKDIAKIIDYLYNNASIYLDRKHEKAESFCRPKIKPLKS